MVQATRLKNGEYTADLRLDRCRQYDLRSLNYPVSDILTADQYSRPRSYTWRLQERLDQGPDGACVGFGFAHELAARPGVVSGVTNEFALKDIYWEAQKVDDWPGGAYPGASPEYDGTSTLAGAKVCKSQGFYKGYRWAFNVADLITAIGYHGPAVMGIDWYENMMEIDEDGFIHPDGEIVGGHCVCLPGVHIEFDSNDKLDPLSSYVVVQNSWGAEWGINGRAGLTLVELAKLFPGGDFCIPIGRVAAAAA